MITAAIGQVINEFTTLQPILMSILICCSFATLIISPISTVAIGLAIQLNGVSAGARCYGGCCNSRSISGSLMESQ